MCTDDDNDDDINDDYDENNNKYIKTIIVHLHRTFHGFALRDSMQLNYNPATIRDLPPVLNIEGDVLDPGAHGDGRVFPAEEATEDYYLRPTGTRPERGKHPS